LIGYNIFRYGHEIVFVGLQSALMGGIVLEWLRDRRARRFRPPAGEDAGPVPVVSVIVPVHNEAARIGGLLQSLLRQDYPETEFIFVDDRSSDASPALLAAFAEERRETRILRLEENPGPNHKQYALGRGIDAARGSLFLFTDADCEVPPGWVRAMALRMADPRVGALIAPVFKQRGGPGFFHLYQCYDHTVRYVYLAGAVGIGAGGGGFGNNLILRRASLDRIGGYSAVPPSPTEDAALISLLRSRSAGTIRAALGADVFVMTRAEKNWKDFVSQTLRWNNGGLFSPEPLTRLNFNILMLIISTGILAIPLLPLFPGLWPLPLGVFIVMLMNTAAALGPLGPGLPRAGAAYFFQLLFTPVYFTFLTILGYAGVKIKWKGSPVGTSGPPDGGPERPV
jgi:cellulose synthase/poly-beta-1,6-N-acetylglucosamine synthase-like glycosyltransferase